MAITATHMADDPMSSWASGTQHWVTSDGRHLAVESSNEAIPPGAEQMINEALEITGFVSGQQRAKMLLREAVVFECNEDGSPIDLTPVATFPPRTTHIQALRRLGYQVT